MPSVPVSLFEKIPSLTQALNAGRNLFLIFNLECIDNSHGRKTGQNLIAIQRRIHWIADRPDIITAVLSNGPQNELEAIFDNRNIILAPNNGTEIYSARFNWILPDLNNIRHELTEIFTGVQESLGPALLPEHLSFSQNELWLKASTASEETCAAVAEQFKANNPSLLRLDLVNNLLTVTPRQKWDRGQAVLKLVDLIPFPGHQPPVVIYFGVEEDDEAAFQIANQQGLSVIIHSRLSRSTRALCYLRDSVEFSKFLFWVHSR